MAALPDTYYELLKRHWGYDSFRPTQEKIIASVAEGKDTLGLMPTGGGKSLTFQVPALAGEGVCLVVTPLIALMKDQVMGLRKRGIQAEAIHTGMRRNNMVILLDNCALGGVKFLYVSPERLSTRLFLDKLPHLGIKWLVVDEAHCISQWGYDFRPSYLNIADIRLHLPGVPVLALTATATPQVVDDIQNRLQFPQRNVVQMSFERKNLVYYVRNTEDKLSGLLTIFQKMRGCGIVYVRSRKKTQELAEYLVANNVSATHYHAGLSSEEKEEKQKAWMKDEVRVMVSTNAFGMGIDKPDVRLVVHIDVPDSLEAYFQEAGRGGRDGNKAFSILLYNNTDDSKLKKQFTSSFPPKDVIIKIYQTLCNYYQIAIGAGQGRHFDFDLAEFCRVYKLSRVQTHYALKILHNAGYIYLTDQAEGSSRLYIMAGKDELYRFQEQNESYEAFIKLILRTYTGLFSSFVYISEKFLSKKSGLTPHQIYETLVALNKFKLIKYIPGKNLPQVIFKRDREPAEYVSIGRAVYDDLKERYKNRIEATLSYASSQLRCRSVTLLHYFGEKHAKPCGQCDVCRKQADKGVSDEHFEAISSWVQLQIPEEGVDLDILLKQATFSKDDVIYVVRYLADHGKLKLNELDRVYK